MDGTRPGASRYSSISPLAGNSGTDTPKGDSNDGLQAPALTSTEGALRRSPPASTTVAPRPIGSSATARSLTVRTP